MKLAIENKYGAYIGMEKEFLSQFNQIDGNLNFDVFESKDAQDFLMMKIKERANLA
jgi:hypothetical protein